VGSVVDKVAPGEDFLRVLRLSPVNIFPPLLHLHSCIIWGLNDRPISSLSSTKTYSPPFTTITIRNTDLKISSRSSKDIVKDLKEVLENKELLLIMKILSLKPENISPVISKHCYGVNVIELTQPLTTETCPDITNQYLCPFVNCHCNRNCLVINQFVGNLVIL
jgi:hypothetical protein